MAKGFKSGGRVQGSVNLITREVRESLLSVFNEQVERISITNELSELRARNEVIRTILPYIVPRLAYEGANGEVSPVVVQVHGNI
jgi:hypothetical protein